MGTGASAFSPRKQETDPDPQAAGAIVYLAKSFLSTASDSDVKELLDRLSPDEKAKLMKACGGGEAASTGGGEETMSEIIDLWNSVAQFKNNEGPEPKMGKKLASEEDVAKAFLLFDYDEGGKISYKKLKEACKKVGKDLSDDAVQYMIDEADSFDYDGEVNAEEFLYMMKKAKYVTRPPAPPPTPVPEEDALIMSEVIQLWSVWGAWAYKKACADEGEEVPEPTEKGKGEASEDDVTKAFNLFAEDGEICNPQTFKALRRAGKYKEKLADESSLETLIDTYGIAHTCMVMSDFASSLTQGEACMDAAGFLLCMRKCGYAKEEE